MFPSLLEDVPSVQNPCRWPPTCTEEPRPKPSPGDPSAPYWLLALEGFSRTIRLAWGGKDGQHSKAGEEEATCLEPGLPPPTLLTLALFSMVTASSTRSPEQKVPVWSFTIASSSISVAAPGPSVLLDQFRLTTRFSYRMRCCPLRPHGQC